MNSVLSRSVIDTAVADVREIVTREGAGRSALERIRERLIELALRRDLFNAADYPPPKDNSRFKSCFYRMSEDPDHHFALYLNSSLPGHATPPHMHSTWAVIAGVSGEERNSLFEREFDGVREKGRFVVTEKTAIAFLPEELHSTQVQKLSINFHMYGVALELQHPREYYDAGKRTWCIFPPHGNIRDAQQRL